MLSFISCRCSSLGYPSLFTCAQISSILRSDKRPFFNHPRFVGKFFGLLDKNKLILPKFTSGEKEKKNLKAYIRRTRKLPETKLYSRNLQVEYFFRCFQISCFVNIVLFSFNIILIFLFLPVPSYLFPRVVSYVLIVLVFYFCFNILTRFFVLVFFIVVVDFLDMFPV